MNWHDLDEQWRQRHDPAQVAALTNALEQALTGQGAAAEYALLWRGARLAHFQAMQAEASDDGQAAYRHFAAGAEMAQRALRLQSYGIEGNFWYGVNLIEAERRHGHGLARSWAASRALPTAVKYIERTIGIDETYHFAGPLRVGGRLMHLKPLLLGGSVDRAMEYYRRALQIAPGNSTTLLYYAEALLADKQRRAARNMLRQIVEAADDPDWRWEQERDRSKARTLLLEIGESV
ncbi:MAG TPA: TRAP transporter TatT component family protein [Abditibacteriaceae bacterium]|nr:TRAP transporter TatT component family protein [Abditibacteriaceae bacterium]